MQYILIIRNHFKAEYHYIKINEFHDTKLIDLFMNINKPKKNWIEFRENLNFSNRYFNPYFNHFPNTFCIAFDRRN